MLNQPMHIIDLINQNKLFISLFLITLFLVIRWILLTAVRKSTKKDNEFKRRLSNTITNVMTLLMMMSLFILWLTELRVVALSVAAFVVAIVIATREIIQCLLGAIFVASARMFSIGDWIKINNHYGEVVKSDWLSTTMLEIDMESISYSYTGISLVIPNHKFITGSMQNLNFMRRYIAHSFSIVCEPDKANIFDAKDLMLKKAKEYCCSFVDVAERYNTLLESRLGITLFGPEASVRITTNSVAKTVMTITIFCPTHEAVSIEQKLTEDFMAFWHAKVRKVISQSHDVHMEHDAHDIEHT